MKITERKILFGGTITIGNETFYDKAILLENQKLIAINNLKAFVKTEPILTITDLINIDGKKINLKQEQVWLLQKY